MPKDKINLELARNDVGQILDGLYIRKHVWENTRKYLETGFAEGEIEECSSNKEAERIASLYGRIIREIESQMNA